MQRKLTINRKFYLYFSKTFAIALFFIQLEIQANPLLAQYTLTIKANDISLAETFGLIKKKTGLTVFYGSSILNDREKVSLNFENTPLEEVMKHLLKDKDIDYEVRRNKVIVLERKKKQPALTTPTLLPIQQSIIRGRVVDENSLPLPGVSISVKNKPGIGTLTDEGGNFSLDVPTGNVLVFTYTGYVQHEEQVQGQTIAVQMKPQESALDEVVVVGYGSVRKSDLTGSVSSVKEADITALPSINAMQSLTGRSAGVQVTQSSGAPGAGMNVRIRGGNSILGGNEPLYVVDGFAISGRPTILDPTDIASMEILKDASATAIYGSRGANGVVLITTKRGKSGTSQVNIDSYVGMQQVIRTMDVLNARQFAEMANERAFNDNTDPYFTLAEINGFGEGTNWQNEIFRTAPIQNHSLNFSGGNDKTQYAVSGSYFDQQGIIINSAYQRGSLRSSIQHDVSDKLKLNLTSILSRTISNNIRNDNEHRGTGVVSAALVAPPTVLVRDASGAYADVAPYVFSPNVNENPVALANEILNRNTGSGVLTNLGLNYEFIEGLTLNVSAGIDYANSKTDGYSPRIFRNSPAGAAYTEYYTRNNFLNENILNYNKTFDKHTLDLTAGITYQSEKVEQNSMGASGFANDLLLNNNLQAGTIIGTPTASVLEWQLLSGLARANYAYQDKYLFTASIRADGSSRFGATNQWGYFPSAALGWRVSEEDFLKDNNSLSNLKLRASIGQTGNTAINPYQSLNVLGGNNVVFGDNLYTGFAPNQQRPNPDLKWETTTQTNVGFDVGFFSDRFRLIADYYVKNTTDLLAQVPTPTSSGFTSQIRNIGKIRNAGFEVELGADIFTTAFKWDVAANFSANRNRAIELANNADVFGAQLTIPLNVSVNLVREGHPVGVFYGYVEDGLDENGRITYRDLDGNGSINNLDRTIIGDPNPDFIWGLNNNLSYKGFSLNVFLQGVQGADLFNYNLSNHANAFNFGENQVVSALDRWTAENPNPNAANPVTSVGSSFRESDRYVEDGSFIRLKNLRLGYAIPVPSRYTSWLKSLQLYVSGQNLFTITNYSWYDPEVSTRLGESGTSSISLGIDQTSYPVAKTYTFGINIGL